MGLSKAAVEREWGLHLATVRKLAQARSGAGGTSPGARQFRASGKAVRAKVSHVLQAVHDLVHLLLRGHRGFTAGVLRDVL
jgi:hypothetical protein